MAILAVSAFAFWRGGWPERAAAAGNLVAWGASLFVQNRSNWVDPQWAVAAVDAAFLLFLLWLVVRSDRWWILPAAAFQLLAVITHVGILADKGVRAWAYLTALTLWSYLVLIALAGGAYMRWRLTARPAR